MKDLCNTIREELDGMPVADIHTHLGVGGTRQAKSLAHIVSYHWLSVELARAKGSEIKSDPMKDPDGYMNEVISCIPAIRNTVNHYALMGMLRNLYGLEDRMLTEVNWKEIDRAVRERADDPSWIPEVLDRGRIEKVVVYYQDGMPDETERYIPYEYAEYLYSTTSRKELAQISGSESDLPVTAADLQGSIDKRISLLASEHGIRALHIWPRGTWLYRIPDEKVVTMILGRLAEGEDISSEEEDILMSFAADGTAAAAASHGMVLQLFHGSMDYTGKGNASYWNPEFLRCLTHHFHKNSEARYDLFLASRIPSHEAANISRFYHNLAVSGAWWHGFTPTTMRTYFRDRLEILPNTAWNAFYSDGYIVEWIYGKLLITKKILALVLAEMVDEGYMTEEDSLSIARRLLYDNAMELYGLTS